MPNPTIVIDMTQENFPAHYDSLQNFVHVARDEGERFCKEAGLPSEAATAIVYSLVIDAIKKLETLRDDLQNKAGVGRVTHLIEEDGEYSVESIKPNAADLRKPGLN